MSLISGTKAEVLNQMQNRKILCALDTGDLDAALSSVRRLAPYVGGFKVGHALTLPHGLDVLDRLREAGADRIFLDLKFHDIPNSVALAVREASKRKVWMLTLHASGGQAMLSAAAEEAASFGEGRPLLVGVTVLTSIDERTLSSDLGVPRSVQEQAVHLGRVALDSGVDGVVCSPHEISAMRSALGAQAIIVTPGIRLETGPSHDQKRAATPQKALADGSDYLVIGRALSEADDLESALEGLGFERIKLT